MKIELDIPASRIASLMSSAIEGGDPVTTATKGGWCAGIYWRSRELPEAKLPKGCWYANAQTFAKRFTLEIAEVVNEATGRKSYHKIGPRHLREGLTIMARKYPIRFGQILDDNVDAPCADLFLQCVLFGEEKYT